MSFIYSNKYKQARTEIQRVLKRTATSSLYSYFTLKLFSLIKFTYKCQKGNNASFCEYSKKTTITTTTTKKKTDFDKLLQAKVGQWSTDAWERGSKLFKVTLNQTFEKRPLSAMSDRIMTSHWNGLWKIEIWGKKMATTSQEIWQHYKLHRLVFTLTQWRQILTRLQHHKRFSRQCAHYPIKDVGCWSGLHTEIQYKWHFKIFVKLMKFCNLFETDMLFILKW